MGGNTCAVSLKGLFISRRGTIQTVSKQVRPSLFRFDTRSSRAGETARGKNFPETGGLHSTLAARGEGLGIIMDDRQVLVYIRSVQSRFEKLTA